MNLSSSAITAAELPPPKHKLIRGSKKAVTITKREYLKTDWCKTEPFQQIIHMVRSPLLLIRSVYIGYFHATSYNTVYS